MTEENLEEIPRPKGAFAIRIREAMRENRDNEKILAFGVLMLQNLFKSKNDIYKNTLPCTLLIDLGDYVIVRKETLEHWFGSTK